MLGRAVVDAFEDGYAVLPLARADCDLADAGAARTWFALRAPQVIVHCAAYTDVDGCESDPERAQRDNVEATANVARAAAAADALLCHLSTDYVFDGTKPGPYAESDAPAPLGIYGRTKLEAERAVVRLAPRHVIVRTSWVFGPGGRNFVRTIAGLLRQREVIRVVDDQMASPTYTRDLAAALRHIVAAGVKGTLHVTNAGTCTWYGLAAAIGNRRGTRCRIEACTTAEFPRPAPRPRNSVLANARYRSAGLPALRSWEDALDAYLGILDREDG